MQIKDVFPAILGCNTLPYPAPAHDLYASAKSVEAILWMEWHTLCGLYLVVLERKDVRHLSNLGQIRGILLPCETIEHLVYHNYPAHRDNQQEVFFV